ncbi:MAG: FtsW/RodA/SpoVE family cell cycle protein [Cellulosilyticaceae bacterium]
MKRKKQPSTKKIKGSAKRTPDLLLIAVVIMLVCFGVVMVYSASHYYAMNITDGKDPLMFARKQGIFAVLGICAMLFVAYRFNYRYFSNFKIATAIYIFALGLSASLFVIGTSSKGATRWIQLPGGITFQPSELAKIAMIIMLAAYIVRFRNRMHQLKYVVIGAVIILIPTGLILIENLSSAIVVGSVGFIILFVSTPKVWYYIAAILLGVFVVVWVYNLAMTSDPNVEFEGWKGQVFKQYRMDRIRVWKDPWLDETGGGYQPIQSLYAVGSGGLFGLGLGLGVQKLGFLPEPHNDIIFAVICEELGLVGAAILMLTYAVLVLRGLSIASNAYDLFGALLATGISSMVGIQVLINMAVNTNTIPTTGMQLPLISYGGSALVMLLGSLGLLINVSRMADIKKPTR